MALCKTKFFELDEDTNILNYDIIFVERFIGDEYQINYYEESQIKFIITSFLKDIIP